MATLVPSTDSKRSMIKAGVACRARADALETYLAEQASRDVASAREGAEESNNVRAAAGGVSSVVAAEFGY